MIQEFVDKFMAKEDDIRAKFSVNHPDDYGDIVKTVIEAISDGEYRQQPDPERIHEINDGSYQGTLLYVIGANGYQPDDYWFVKVSYGSCSGCDTLEAIRAQSWWSDSDKTPTDEQVQDYWTLALHIVQGLKAMDGGDANYD